MKQRSVYDDGPHRATALPAHRAALAARRVGIGLLTTAISGASAFLLLRFLQAAALPEAASAPAETEIETLVASGIALIGLFLAAWYTLSTTIGTACAMSRLIGSTWRAGERLLSRRGAPGVARLVGAGTGAALAASLALSPAYGAPAAPEPAGADLTWGAPAEPAAPDGDPTTHFTDPATPVDHAAAPGASSAPTQDTHTVRPGESLWSIAAVHLPGDATNRDIAAAWPRWYQANRDVIGSDPDLILSGMRLHAPPGAGEEPTTDPPTTPSKGATR